MLLGRYDIKSLIAGSTLEAVAAGEHDVHLAIFAKGDLAISVPPVLAGPHQHVAAARCKRGLAFVVGKFGGGRIELAVIIDAEFYLSAFNGVADAVQHLYLG